MANEFDDLIPENNENYFSDLIPKKSITDSGAFKTMQAFGQVVPALEVGAREITGLLGSSLGGLAGLGSLATNKIGLTNVDPTNIIENVSGALTYEPKTSLGQHLGQAVDYPFQKLGEAGQSIGGSVLEKTDSPLAATTAQVATQLLPLAAIGTGPRVKYEKPKPLEVKEPKEPLVEVRPKSADEIAAAEFLEKDIIDIPDKAININLRNIESSDDVKAAITQTSEIFSKEIDDARRGVITNAQTEALADSLAMTPQQLLKRRKGQAFSSEEALASRKIMVDSASNLREKAKAAEGGGIEDLNAFREALGTHAAIQAQVSGMTAEAGRALQQFRIKVKEDKARAKAIKEILDSMGGRGQLEDMAAAISELDDPAKLNRFIDDLNRAKTSDVFLEAWINGLLSGPQTHAVNITSNSLVALWTLPETMIAAGIGKLHGGEKVRVREAASRAYGLVEGVKEGLRAGGKSFLREEPSDLMSKIELPRQESISGKSLGLSGKSGKAADVIGRTVRIPGRALMAEDEFFKAIGYRMELNRLAMKTGLDEDLKGQALAERINEIKRNPPEDLHLASIDQARYQTFTKPLGTTGRAIMQFANSHPAAKVIIPFIRTPTNIVKFAGERSPFAFFSKNVQAELKKGGAARDMALAKIAMGSSIGAMVASLASEGLITGGGPSSPEAMSTLRATGWQPYSVKVGDKYISYSRLEPLGMIMGISADMSDIAGMISDKESDEIAARIVSAITNNLTSKTWLRGASDLVEMVNDPDRYGDRWLQRYAGTLVPTAVATYTRSEDPVIRQTETMIDGIKARLPGYSKDLLPRRNVWGEPIVLQGGLGPDMISPFYVSKDVKDKVSEEAVRLNVRISRPTKTLSGAELLPKEHNRLQELSGKMSKSILDQVVNSDAWDSLPDFAKERTYIDVINTSREAARKQLMAEFPEITRRVVTKKLEGISK